MTRRSLALLLFTTLMLAACSDGGGSGATPDGGADAGADGGDLGDPPALALHAESAPLTELGAQAVALAPAWVRHDVGIALRQQEAARADELAALIVDAIDPRLIDEIAFGIAHTSPEVMELDQFFPELLALNAELIYEHDAQLDYVELVETGVAGTDDDFWTTVEYTFLDGESVEEKTFDRDIYYWYVVHPKMEDENPWFIDAWQACSSSSLECAATPDEGWFWRELLWDAAKDGCPEEGLCPTLDDWLPGVEHAWDGSGYGSPGDAIETLVDFMFHQPEEGYNWLVFGAYGERSIQPNRIYGLGRGNCGEWADMTTALGRTALMPFANVSPTLWDHTWNTFYDDKWIEMEPVNHAIDADYSGWGGFANANFFMTRGDGLALGQTPDYRDDWFTMVIEVLDADGAPVPGASVSAWQKELDGSLHYYAGEGPTDEDGLATFELKALETYKIRVETPLGVYPDPSEGNIAEASSGVEAGATDVRSYTMGWALAEPLPATVVGFAGEPAGILRLELDDLAARFVTKSRRFGITYTVDAPAPEIQMYLVDEANYALAAAGEPFAAAWAGVAADADVGIPLDGAWYLVLSNAAQMSTAAFGTLSLEIDPLEEGAWSGSASFELPYELLPGGLAAVSITPAE